MKIVSVTTRVSRFLPFDPQPEPKPRVQRQIKREPVQTVSFYTLIAIQAARRSSHCGGGFRLWTLAKALDVIGLGMIRRQDLRAALIAMGESPRNWQRWLIEARNHDMISDIQKAGEWWLILNSPARVALAMGLDSVGSKARINAADLFGKGWRARVYSAWEHGKQITREQIQKAVNVPVSTQRYRDHQAGILRTRNYSKSAISADHLTGIKELTKHKAPFVMRDGFIAWRLPDMRESKHIERISKGRSRKINFSIRSHSQKGLSKMRRALTDGNRREFIRLFNQTEAQRRQAERKASKLDKRINELYQRAETAKTGAVIWQHCPMGG